MLWFLYLVQYLQFIYNNLINWLFSYPTPQLLKCFSVVCVMISQRLLFCACLPCLSVHVCLFISSLFLSCTAVRCLSFSGPPFISSNSNNRLVMTLCVGCDVFLFCMLQNYLDTLKFLSFLFIDEAYINSKNLSHSVSNYSYV